ncbi:DUF948 domain-containing protein [Trichococcus ilyis]|jgi:uncharacterized protein YoxC|uniref:Uncharacterized protein YoxC, contains an MCP-like domain n=1 Tax=Trichococcus ilyis TaxID=640938 RepID=A0A143YV86_9LACT|nr:DUF948 domain-containing protein [Trichococcus ilyis]CZQ97954.1 Hypothetical protein TR210_1521 [Trichococcus ilyis]SEJ19280.1 Uncharacterized protein YoxC, contains an MCP-like domain [Trichococcus ilyis]
MGYGEIAALIAALAFAVLVVFIILALRKVTDILAEVEKVTQEANKSLAVITKDVDHLSIEVEGLLNKANTLVDDLNGKISKTDPLFTAIGDLGVTVSDVNQSTRNLAVSLKGGGKGAKGVAGSSTVGKLGRTAMAMARQRQSKKESKDTKFKTY